MTNIKDYRDQFNGSGDYSIQYGNQGRRIVHVNTFDELVTEFEEYMKQYLGTEGCVHSVTKIGQ